MKKIKKLLAALLLVACAGFVTTLPTTTATAEPVVGVSFQYFYDNLSPYGTWVSYPGYGYAWIPRAAPGFRPYFSSGQWAYTDLGWTWVSYYDWGWAPFHYGSWQYDPFYGWLWVPGYSWAPSWVTWGYCNGYYGWAPIAPGISFSVGYYPPIDYWVFVPPQYVGVSGWNNSYYVARDHRISFSNNTYVTNVRTINVVNNPRTYNGQQFSAGPSREEFEKNSNTRLNTVSLRDNNAPGKARLSGNNLSVYRPAVDSRDKASAKPSSVTPLEKMKVSDSGNGRTKGGDNRTAEMKNNNNVKQTAPAQKQNSPARTVAPQQKSDAQEQIKMQQRKQEIQRRNESMQPQPLQKVRQPDARPKSNVEKVPQMKSRKSASPQPAQQPRPERMEQPQREMKSAPERQQMEREVQREPRQMQPQPQQREERGNNNPKRFSF